MSIPARLTAKERKDHHPFLLDIQQLRARAQHAMRAVSAIPIRQIPANYIIDILQTILATEIVCMLRYTMNAITAAELGDEALKREFLAHAKDEHDHMERIAMRIKQLGGRPDFNPPNLAIRAASEYMESGDLSETIKENLVTEEFVCDYYHMLVQFFAERDSDTMQIVKDMNEKERGYIRTRATSLSYEGPSLASLNPAPSQSAVV